MPIYEYECKYCGEIKETLKNVADRDMVPNCNFCGRHMERLISSVGIATDMQFRDSKGTHIWFPKNKNKYYDRALQKEFHSVKHKQKYMKDNNLIMDGSLSKNSKDPAAGDRRKVKPVYSMPK